MLENKTATNAPGLDIYTDPWRARESKEHYRTTKAADPAIKRLMALLERLTADERAAYARIGKWGKPTAECDQLTARVLDLEKRISDALEREHRRAA